MNGYICFWKNRRIEVYAETTYAAQKEAARILKVKRSYEITEVLAEKGGEQVIHSTSEL